MQLRRTHWIFAAIAAAGLLLAQSEPAKVMMEAAHKKEVVDGDLNGAIKQYAAIVARYKNDRAVTAMALVRMAECYQKMGDAESRKIFEQVVREYGDQKDAVAEARARLGGTAVKTGRQTNTLVWSNGKADDEGTVSPDGRYLSYTDWDTGDLAIHEFPSGEDRLVTHTGNVKGGRWKDFAEESAISRDGRQVAFSWWNEENHRYDLRVANLTGEPRPRRLYDDPGNSWMEPCDWSPDGKSIVVLLSRKDGTDRLGLVSSADGKFQILRSGVWPGNTHAFFSPDGKLIGYDLPESDVSEPRDLFVYSLPAGRDIPISTRHGQDIMMGWSPDGKLLFASDRTGSLGLWGLTLREGKPQGIPELLKTDLGAVSPLGVTQGGALYYGLHTGTVDGSLYVASFDFATGRLSSRRELPKDFPESQEVPRWSPDGKYLAHLVRRGSGYRTTGAVVIRSAETLQAVRELPLKVPYLSGWSPDGQSLLLWGPEGGKWGAFQLDVQTGTTTPLTTDDPGKRRIQDPVWSPDAKRLYFSRVYPDDNTMAILERSVASGVEKELIRGPLLGGGAQGLSPDGKYIMTASIDTASNSRALLLIPTGGGQPVELMRVPSEVTPETLRNTNRGRWINGVVWAPDSSAVLVRERRGTELGAQAWVIPVGGGAPRKVDLNLDNIGAFRLDPSGRRVAYVQREPAPPRQTQIWALENFLAAAK